MQLNTETSREIEQRKFEYFNPDDPHEDPGYEWFSDAFAHTHGRRTVSYKNERGRYESKPNPGWVDIKVGPNKAFVPKALAEFVERHRSFIQSHPSLVALFETKWDTSVHPDDQKDIASHNFTDVMAALQALPQEDPAVKKFLFEVVKFGVRQRIITEIKSRPEFGNTPEVARFLRSQDRFSFFKGDEITERKKNGEALIYTNGIENIGEAFLSRFGTPKKRKYEPDGWERNHAFFLNNAFSHPYTRVEDIMAQQKLFTTLNTPEALAAKPLLDEATEHLADFHAILGIAVYGDCFRSLQGSNMLSIQRQQQPPPPEIDFDAELEGLSPQEVLAKLDSMQVDDYEDPFWAQESLQRQPDGKIFYDPYGYQNSMAEFYTGTEDPQGVITRLQNNYGKGFVPVDTIVEDGLEGLEQAKSKLQQFTDVLESLGDFPFITDFVQEVETFFEHFTRRHMLRDREWKTQEVFYGDNGQNEWADELECYESFMQNFKVVHAIFEFLALAKTEGWQPITFDPTKPTGYQNGWHLKFDKTGQTPGSMVVDGRIKAYSGANTSGKSWGGLKRDAYQHMAAQSLGYAPADGYNLRQPFSSMVLLDRPDPHAIKQMHFSDSGRRGKAAEPSAFMQEMGSIADSLHYVTDNAALYLDEVGSTTSPEDQAALLLAIIEDAKQRGSQITLSTHNELVLKYLAQQHPGLETDLLHFATQDSAIGIENTYELEAGQADSNFLEVCRRQQAPQALIQKAQAYLDGTWQLGQVEATAAPAIVPYSAEEREALKAQGRSTEHLFPEAGSFSVFKFYSGNDNLQSWMSFASDQINHLIQQQRLGQIQGKKRRQKAEKAMQIESNSFFSDRRYLSLLVKLLLHTPQLSSQEALERRALFKELAESPQLETLTQVIKPLERYDKALDNLSEADREGGINRDFGAIDRMKELCWRTPNDMFSIESEPYLDQMWNIKDQIQKLRPLVELNDCLGQDCPQGKALRSRLDLWDQLAPLITGIEDDRLFQGGGLYENGAYRNFLDDTDSESETDLVKMTEIKAALAKAAEVVPGVTGNETTYKVFDTILRDLVQRIEAYSAVLTPVPFAEIGQHQDPKVAEIARQLAEIERYPDKNKSKEDEDKLLIDDPKNYWSDFKRLKDFPEHVAKIKTIISGMDSVYLQQSITWLEAIAVQVQNGEYDYNAPTEETVVLGGNQPTRSRLGKRQNTRTEDYQDIDNTEGKKRSDGEIRKELLRIQALIHWANLVKYLEFSPVDFTDERRIEIPGLKHLSNLQKDVPNDVSLSVADEQTRVLTGPNGSGKTYHEQGFALGVMCGLSTGFIPTADGSKTATMPLIDLMVYMDRVLEQNDDGLSAGAVEIEYWKEILPQLEQAQCAAGCFDELFSSTSPKYQEACTMATLDIMRQNQVLGMIATHNHQAVESTKSETALARIWPAYHFDYQTKKDPESGAMKINYDRNITKGHAPSEGIIVAGMMGISADIVERARHFKKLITQSKAQS